jgi:uncharacterized protein YecT (DUF1311 family)
LPQQGINLCLAQSFTRSKARCRPTYAATFCAPSRGGRGNDARGQLAWITYRHMMCDVEAGMMRGGSGEPMLRFSLHGTDHGGAPAGIGGRLALGMGTAGHRADH